MADKRRRGLLLYSALFIAFAVAGATAVTVVVDTRTASVHTVALDGMVVLGYPNAVPTSVVLEGGSENYTALVGDASASCGCGGYFYMTTVPNQQTYTVAIYYTVGNGSRVCTTRLSVSSGTDLLYNLIRCP